MTVTIILGSIAGVATFFGLFKAFGSLIGKAMAKKKKAEVERLTALIHDPDMKAQALDAIKKADEYFTSEQGQAKMDWVASKVSALIPGTIDDGIIRDILEGLVQAYKKEIAL